MQKKDSKLQVTDYRHHELVAAYGKCCMPKHYLANKYAPPETEKDLMPAKCVLEPEN